MRTEGSLFFMLIFFLVIYKGLARCLIYPFFKAYEKSIGYFLIKVNNVIEKNGTLVNEIQMK